MSSTKKKNTNGSRKSLANNGFKIKKVVRIKVSIGIPGNNRFFVHYKELSLKQWFDMQMPDRKQLMVSECHKFWNYLLKECTEATFKRKLYKKMVTVDSIGYTGFCGFHEADIIV